LRSSERGFVVSLSLLERLYKSCETLKGVVRLQACVHGVVVHRPSWEEATSIVETLAMEALEQWGAILS